MLRLKESGMADLAQIGRGRGQSNVTPRQRRQYANNCYWDNSSF
jgi:hypothetical protein